MLTKSRIPLLIALICCLEAVVYLLATYTTEESNLIFEKCTRNSGRISAGLNLIILLMVGYNGLKTIYKDDKKRDSFRILITLFAVNHLIHFFFLYQNFQTKPLVFEFSDHVHGFLTFIFILLLPIILWTFRNLNWLLYFGIIFHLINSSYFIMETFYIRIKPDRPSYFHQVGIFIIIIALLYIVYRVIREMSSSFIVDSK